MIIDMRINKLFNIRTRITHTEEDFPIIEGGSMRNAISTVCTLGDGVYVISKRMHMHPDMLDENGKLLIPDSSLYTYIYQKITSDNINVVYRNIRKHMRQHHVIETRYILVKDDVIVKHSGDINVAASWVAALEILK